MSENPFFDESNTFNCSNCDPELDKPYLAKGVVTNHGLFNPGTFYITPGAESLLAKSHRNAEEFINRHLTGDWGEERDPEDVETNALCLSGGTGAFLMSAYSVLGEEKLWIITHIAGHTTLLLPEEY